MSSRFNSAYASRSGVATGSAFVFAGRVLLHSLPSAGQYACLLTLFNGSAFNGWSLLVGSDGRLKWQNHNADALDSANGATALGTSTWYYLWIRMPSAGFDQVFVYLNASTTPELTSASFGALSSPALIRFGAREDGSQRADASFCGWKGWASALAATNAATEDDGHALVTTTGALGEWWFDGTDITDHYTTANHLTATGSITAGPNSPIDGASGVDGTGAATLPMFTASSSAISTVVGQSKAGLSLPMFTASGAGASTVTGTAAPSLPMLTASGAGASTVTGTAAPSLPMLTASGAGTSIVTGTAAASVPMFTASGAGALNQSPGDAIAAVTLPMFTASGAGASTVTGSAAPSLPMFTTIGVGISSVAGAAGVALPMLTASGAGTALVTGQGKAGLSLPMLTAAGVLSNVGFGTARALPSRARFDHVNTLARFDHARSRARFDHVNTRARLLEE